MLLVVLGLAIAILPSLAQAQACGGRVVHNADCDSNGRQWTYSCCPDGYRVQGVAYNDLNKQDHVDAISAVCRSISKGNDMMPSDFSKTPISLVCNKTEVMAGVASKDVKVNGGDSRDTLDGVTAVCQTPASTSLRTIANNDIDQNSREASVQTVLLPKRVVGIATKDRDNGGNSAGSSDRADCVTVIVK